MIKKYLLLLILLIIIPLTVKAETCNNLVIKTITMVNKSEDVLVIDEASIIDNKINIHMKMNTLGDYIQYEMEIKNQSNEEITLDENTFQIESDYLDYNVETEDGSNVIQANETKTIQLNIEYAREIPNQSFYNNAFSLVENKKIKTVVPEPEPSPSPEPEKEKPISIIDNPKTKNTIKIFLIVITLIIASIMAISKKKKAFFITLLALYPICTQAACVEKIEINTTVDFHRVTKRVEILSGQLHNLQRLDEVRIGDSEEFYVISSDNSPGGDTILFAKYNILVGNEYEIIWNENSSWNTRYIRTYTEDDEGYGMQNSEIIGRHYPDTIAKGLTIFSTTKYWSIEEGETYKYVYDSNSLLYDMIEYYVSLLRNMINEENISGRVIDYTTELSETSRFPTNSEYWTGNVRSKTKENILETGLYSGSSYSISQPVRPVIIIKTSIIEDNE